MTISLPRTTDGALPPPRYDASRCAAGAPGEQGCRACVDNCPYGAMQFLDQPGGRVVHIDPGICARCGACTGLCPTSALERAFASDDELLAAVTEKADQQGSSLLVLTCAESAQWIRQAFKDPPAIIEVPSILILNETHLLHALERFDRLAVVGCAGCHHRSPALLGPAIARARRLAGRDDGVIYIEDDRSEESEALFRQFLCVENETRLCPKTQEAGREATPQVPSPPNCSRFFRVSPQRMVPREQFGGGGRVRGRGFRTEPNVPTAARQDAASQKTRLRLQEAECTRRDRLRLLLTDRIDRQPRRTFDDPSFGQVELTDEAACIMCGACTRACPTEALRIDDGELSFSPVDCVNCQLCQQACPEKIVHVAPGLQVGPDLLERRTLVADEMIPCRSCGQPHIPRRLRHHVRLLLDAVDGPLASSTEQVDLCSACRDTTPDRTFNASPPANNASAPPSNAPAPASPNANGEASRPEPAGLSHGGRRGFLQGAATAALTVFGKSAFGQAKTSPETSPKTSDADAVSRKRLAMVIDVDRCIGCHACTAICKAENHVPLGVFRDWVEEHVLGEYPHATPKFLPKLCNHCDDPGCLRACPTGAIHRRPDGIVDLNHDICIGCRACNQACPYGATFMDPVRGTADKCNFCAHRIDEGLNPACVDICPTGCRIFGDLDDPESPPSQAMRGQSYQELRPELGLGPNVKYLNLPGQLDR